MITAAAVGMFITGLKTLESVDRKEMLLNHWRNGTLPRELAVKHLDTLRQIKLKRD